jgi:hypothetical protein
MNCWHMLNDQILKIVNCSENVGLILSTINKVKSQRLLKYWFCSGLNLCKFSMGLQYLSESLMKAYEVILRIKKNY